MTENKIRKELDNLAIKWDEERFIEVAYEAMAGIFHPSVKAILIDKINALSIRHNVQ